MCAKVFIITLIILIEISTVQSFSSKENCIQVGNKDSHIFRPVPLIAAAGTGTRWISKMIGGGVGLEVSRLDAFVGLIKLYNYTLVPCFHNYNKRSKNLPKMLVKFHYSDYKSKLYENSWKYESMDSIALFRNPYHAIVSSVQHKLSGCWNTDKPSNLTKILSNHPKRIGKAFKIMTRDYLTLYITWLKDCLDNPRRIKILFYEDIVKNPEINLGKILLHFNITHNVQERINSSLEDLKSTNTWKRSDKFLDNKLILSKYLNENVKFKKVIKNGIKLIKNLLVRIKYSDTKVYERLATYNNA